MDDAFELFKSDIEGQVLELMIDAANKLTVVAASIGPKRIVSELIPYLAKVMTVPSDEVLTAIGRQLYNVFDIAGGAEVVGDDGVRIIFACLRQFGEEEEVIVRQSAVLAIQRISPRLTQNQIDTHLLPLFRALATNDLFGARHTAASIIDVVYKAAQVQDREPIRLSLIALAQDETPMVRRVVAIVIPSFCAVISQLAQEATKPSPKSKMTPEQIANEFNTAYDLIKNTAIPIIQQLSIDERDYLRDLTAQAISGLIQHLPLQDYQQYLVPLIKGLVDDLSWKVRQRLSQQCPTIVINLLQRAIYQFSVQGPLLHPDAKDLKALQNSISQPGGANDINKLIGFVFGIYKQLLCHDNNLEVRSVGVLTLSDMLYLSKGIIPPELLNPQAPRQQQLSSATQTTEEDSLTLHLQFVTAAPPHLKKKFTPPPTATKLFTLDQSKACEEIGQGLHDLARELSPLSKVDLCDTFSTLAPFLGFPFVDRHLIPVLNILAQDDHVQVRSTAVLCLEPILAVTPPNVIISHIWPLLEALHTDIRWRVRRAVSTQLAAICYYLQAGDDKARNQQFIQESIVPMIESLLSENVHAVRNRTAVEFRSLMHILGEPSVIKHFLPLCVELFNPKTNYLHRITALHFIYCCSIAHDNACSKKTITDHFTPFFLEALNDQVPNVRILATRYILALLKGDKGQKIATKDLVWTPAYINQNFTPIFKTMSTDRDREVQLQGTLALELVTTFK